MKSGSEEAAQLNLSCNSAESLGLSVCLAKKTISETMFWPILDITKILITGKNAWARLELTKILNF